MKVLLDKYPLGSLKGQRKAGRYVDGFLYENLKIIAEKIVDDMTFMGVCFSSTLEVGTGKSVFCTQLGEIWSELMHDIHGIDVPFTMHNLVFRPRDLMTRAFEVPKYSFVLVDEWEDAHYWSELGTTLRQFFRKCRQLNLFIMIIIPNFFQLPMPYAISRSFFAVDVKFMNKLERGYFDFYTFANKKDLYIKGKKTMNYGVTKPAFSGRFTDGYGVDEKEYRESKLRDMIEFDKEERISPKELVKQTKVEHFKLLYPQFPQLTMKQWSEVFKVSERTLYDWKSEWIDGDVSTTNSVT